MSADLLALVAVIGLAAAHLFTPMLTFVRFAPRSWFLSAASGVSVAYVFVHLLPDVADAQVAVEESAPTVIAELERHVWLAALLGLLLFYGLERAALRSRWHAGERDELAVTTVSVFWLSVSSFGIYNAIVGYLLVRRAEHDAGADLALFTLALGLHFVVNDIGLRGHHRHRYDQVGRPLLSGAIFLGWIAGTTVELSEAAVGAVVAFLAGGIVLNVLKEEVPSERESRFLPLLGGAAAYAALLLVV